MWYWIQKAEGLPLLPLLTAYYSLKGSWRLQPPPRSMKIADQSDFQRKRIPFPIRCKKCGGWLTEQQYLRTGLCRACHEDMATSASDEYYSEKYYVKPAPVLEPPRVKPAHEPIFTRVAQKVGQGKVLDVGCGIGYLLSKLPKDRQAYGMNMSHDAAKLAQNWVKGGIFCRGDAQHIPYASDTFDYVICMEVLEHIEGDKAARECLRVLKPGGVALITIPERQRHIRENHPSHIRIFNFRSIQDYLRGAGFEIIGGQKFGLHIPFVTGYSSVLSYLVRRNLPLSVILNVKVPEFLSADYLIECRKPVSQ